MLWFTDASLKKMFMLPLMVPQHTLVPFILPLMDVKPAQLVLARH